MPVYKFRSVEALNREIWRTPGDPDLYRAMAGLWAAGARLRPRARQPGVYRYRTIEELDAATPKWRDAATGPTGDGEAELKLRPTTESEAG